MPSTWPVHLFLYVVVFVLILPTLLFSRTALVIIFLNREYPATHTHTHTKCVTMKLLTNSKICSELYVVFSRCQEPHYTKSVVSCIRISNILI